MKIRNGKIWLETKNDRNAYGVEHPFIQKIGEDYYLCATDGHSGIIFKPEFYEDDEVSDGVVSVDAFRSASKFFGSKSEDVFLKLHSLDKPGQSPILAEVADKTFGCANIRFPDMERVLAKKEKKVLARVGVNPKLLVQVAEAIRSEMVVIELLEENKDSGSSYIRIRPNDGKDSGDEDVTMAIVMPARITNKDVLKETDE